MKLPIPIYPTRQEPRYAAILSRLHQPGRFCDKPDAMPSVLLLITASLMFTFAAVAFVRAFF